MRQSIFALCLASSATMTALGSTNVLVENADLVYVTGPGQINVVNGTEVYRNQLDAGPGWEALFSRNASQEGIEVSGDPGTYNATIWSIPTDSQFPQRQVSSTTLVFGPQPSEVDANVLLALLAAWGECPTQGECIFDLNNDNVVNASDLLLLLANWGEPWA